MREIILAMQPRWLNLILDGKKTAEVRRTSPARAEDDPCRLWLYQGGAIHGYANVARVHKPQMGMPQMIWCMKIVDEFHIRACLSARDMHDYLTRDLLGKTYREHWNRAVYELAGGRDFRGAPIYVPCRPQSWMFMTDEVRDIIERSQECES